MDKDDIIHDRIVAFIKKYNIYNFNNKYNQNYDNYAYFYIGNKKPTKIIAINDMYCYNLGISSFIKICLFYFNNEDKIILRQLIIDILNNDYASIRYDFTIEVLLNDDCNWCFNLIQSLKDYNLLSYLERIHPKKLKPLSLFKYQEEQAYINYNEICELQMTWIMTVIKAGAFL